MCFTIKFGPCVQYLCKQTLSRDCDSSFNLSYTHSTYHFVCLEVALLRSTYTVVTLTSHTHVTKKSIIHNRENRVERISVVVCGLHVCVCFYTFQSLCVWRLCGTVFAIDHIRGSLWSTTPHIMCCIFSWFKAQSRYTAAYVGTYVFGLRWMRGAKVHIWSVSKAQCVVDVGCYWFWVWFLCKKYYLLYKKYCEDLLCVSYF